MSMGVIVLLSLIVINIAIFYDFYDRSTKP